MTIDRIDDPSCGCCSGDPRPAPWPVDNRPGLPSLERRIGTHHAFVTTMLRHLARSDRAALRELRRRSDDFSVALLDATATLADVLTFYTERLADEHYLATAKERRSVAELGRLIGRQLQPALAAETMLAFELDPADPALRNAAIPAGTPVQSVPEPGSQPATYETVEELVARPAWNRLRPQQNEFQAVTATNTELILDSAIDIKVGDGVLYRTGAEPDASAFAIVTAVDIVDAVPPAPPEPGRAGYTRIGIHPITTAVRDPAAMVKWREADDVVGPVGGWLAGKTVDADDLAAEAARRRANLEEIAATFRAVPAVPDDVLVFPRQAGIFGSQGPNAPSLLAALRTDLAASFPNAPATVKTFLDGLSTLPWINAALNQFPGGTAKTLYLDTTEPVATGSLIILRSGSSWAGYRAEMVGVVGLSLSGVAGKAMSIELDTPAGLGQFTIRSTTVFMAPRRVSLFAQAMVGPVTGKDVTLERLALGLRAGRRVAVTGEAADNPGVRRAHVTTLAAVTHDFGTGGRTTLTFATPLPEALVRATVTIAANVARATHGETRSEVLGSGDATVPFQRFTLSQSPLTYLSAPTSRGRASTLKVFVNGVEWTEVDSLVGAGPTDRAFTTRQENGVTVVEGGDGVTGAKFPTGDNNIRATYRSGAGLSGRVPADRLTMLAARPAGLKGVTNPTPTEGGSDAESTAAALATLPLLVRTLGRVVSLRDYADFAGAFPGVAKAHATWARAAGPAGRGVLVTVAGPSGAEVGAGNPVYQSLLEALRVNGDPLVSVRVVTFDDRRFRLHASVNVAPEHPSPQVLAAVTDRLARAFSFTARNLGEPLAVSEILRVIHTVAGVVAARVDRLDAFVPGTTAVATGATVPAVLPASLPSATDDLTTAPPAQLLTIDGASIGMGALP